MKWYGYTFDNELGFIISFPNKTDEEKGLRCCDEGVSAWVNPLDIKEEPDNFPHFTENDFDWVHDSGFCDPTKDILYRENIEYRMETDCWNEDGELCGPYKELDIEFRKEY